MLSQLFLEAIDDLLPPARPPFVLYVNNTVSIVHDDQNQYWNQHVALVPCLSISLSKEHAPEIYFTKFYIITFQTSRANKPHPTSRGDITA